MPKKPMNVQSIIFDKDKFSETEARAWLKRNGFSQPKVDETENSLRFRQTDPGRYRTMRTITMTEGVKAVVGKSQPGSSSVHVPSTEWRRKRAPIPPTVDNLEAEVEKDQGDNDTWDLPDMQQLVEGMDYELSQSTDDEEVARQLALENLASDPDYYRQKRVESEWTDDVLAKHVSKDTGENEDATRDNWPVGLNLDLGSGPAREPGYIGLDLYPHDHGTVVHDLNLGIPAPDGSASNVRMVNSLQHMEMEDPKPLLSEIYRVLMPGGQFLYEGPNEIYNYPEWAESYPGLTLATESRAEGVQKGDGDDDGAWVRQRFVRIAVPDAATANDAEPRIGVAQYDMLPADALLAIDALGYEWSDATSSGRGNRIHGYPSQGAIAKSARRVATVAVKRGNELLMGKRNDNGRWTLPGGHAEDGESMLQAAIRELAEESGIEVNHLSPMSDPVEVESGLTVQPFQLSVGDATPVSLDGDPDGEIERWEWVDVSDGLPEDVAGNLHVPTDRNVAINELGLAGSENEPAVGNRYALPEESRYPINSAEQARAALTQASGRAEEQNVRDAVYQAYPELRAPERAGSDDELWPALQVLSRYARMLLSGVVEKSAAAEAPSRLTRIVKADRRRQIVHCVVLSPGELDAQDDWMTPEDIENAAHAYLAKSRVIGSEHMKPIDAVPIESYIAPQDMEWDSGPYGPQTVKKGAWVIGIKVNDPKEWRKIEDGEYQGVSVGGFGTRT